MENSKIIDWLLKGDVSIQYQVHRDLLRVNRTDLRDRISKEGWGAKFLSKRNSNGHWGQRFYQPKWISSHYTLLDLKNLGISPEHRLIRDTINMIANQEKDIDGGINPAVTSSNSDVCVNGMFLNYASYFRINEDLLKSIIDFILSQQLKDGGFNCQFNMSGAVHSSLHSTLSVLEGITEYINNGYSYRLAELKEVEKDSKEFILLHQLYISDRTGNIIRKDFLKLSYPGRWKYDVLRAMDYFRLSEHPWDERMQPVVNIILKKRTKNSLWKLQSYYPGQLHFKMEQAGKPSRWNTLRALRVLNHYKISSL